MADIKPFLNKIKSAVFGKDVRGSLHDGLEAVNKETEDATNLTKETEHRQKVVEQQFDDVLSGWSDDRPTDNAETMASRTNRETGENYATLGQRLDAENKTISSQLADMMLNAKHPPYPLIPVKMDGVSDDTDRLQNLLDYVESIGGGTVFVPSGLLLNSVNYIPTNVKLKGAGIDSTTIKLIDNCAYVSQRKPTGIFPKYNADFFAVEDLTYDGNAEKNVDIHSLTPENFNDYYAHGISNGYADENTDTDSGIIDDRTTKDFLINNVHIKNTIRDCLLISGRKKLRGSVNNVILENSYCDHFIYESHTDTRVDYNNVTLKGFWTGACIVLETGKINNLRLIDPLKVPGKYMRQSGIIDTRNSYKSNELLIPSIKDLDLDINFEDVFYIFSSQSSKEPKGINLENVKINQTDDAEFGSLNVPLSVFNSNGNENVSIRNLEINNAKEITLLACHEGTENIIFDGVVINYSKDRKSIGNSDVLVSFRNGAKGINDIKMKNIKVKEKAPSLFRFSGESYLTVIKNVTFENVQLLRSDRNRDLMITNDVEDFFKVEGFVIKDSRWDGYPPIKSEVLRQFNIKMRDCLHNDIPSSRNIKINMVTGEKTKTVAFDYINNRPRIKNVSIMHRPLPSLPVLRFSNNTLTLNLNEPLVDYEEFDIFVEY